MIKILSSFLIGVVTNKQRDKWTDIDRNSLDLIVCETGESNDLCLEKDLICASVFPERTDFMHFNNVNKSAKKICDKNQCMQ